MNVNNAVGKIKLVLIEDHGVTQRGLESYLSEDAGMLLVGTAATANEGMQLVEQHKPHVLLLDLHLPGQEGPKALLQRCSGLQPATKTIVFSADDRVALVQIAMKLGLSGYILKTEPSRRILDAIRKVASGVHPVISRELIRAQTPLTEAEFSLLEYFAKGHRYNEIAKLRGTSPHTVKKQCEMLIIKLGLNSREELISWAMANGYGSLL
jgi:two-component system nitrate/nitrite response regulator NarL